MRQCEPEDGSTCWIALLSDSIWKLVENLGVGCKLHMLLLSYNQVLKLQLRCKVHSYMPSSLETPIMVSVSFVWCSWSFDVRYMLQKIPCLVLLGNGCDGALLRFFGAGFSELVGLAVFGT